MKNVDAFMKCAAGFAFVRETPPGSNSGQAIDAFLRSVGVDVGQSPASKPWCAAFVAYVGSNVFGALWPLPLSASVQNVYEAARTRKIVHTAPKPGDLFVLWDEKRGRFSHIGICTSSTETIEGNTSKPGDTDPETAREGWGVFRKTRKYTDRDRFIRWSSLIPDT